MRGDGGTALNVGLHGMRLYVLNHDSRSSNNVRRQVRFPKDHLRADVQRQDARELRGRVDVGLSAHVVKVLTAHPEGRGVDARNVVQDSASSLGVEPGVRVHGIGHEAPLVGTLVPVPSISQARIRRLRSATAGALFDFRGSDSLPGVLGDLLAARCAYSLENLDEQWVLEALHLHEVDDICHVQEQFDSLLVLVGLVGGRGQKRCRRWDGGNW